MEPSEKRFGFEVSLPLEAQQWNCKELWFLFHTRTLCDQKVEHDVAYGPANQIFYVSI